MAFELTYEGRGFFIRHWSSVTFEEIADANDQLISHQGWEAHEYQIWSYLEAGAIDADRRDGRIISKVDAMSLGNDRDTPVKVAFVCTNSKSTEIITSYIDTVDPEMYVGKIFRTEADARTWVNG